MSIVVSGTFAATGRSAAFAQLPFSAFNVSLWGTFGAAVRLERSFDGGSTWLPITANAQAVMSFASPVSEQWQEPEAGVLYSLNCTGYTSGTVNYRLSQ